jgi:hypothetical protein
VPFVETDGADHLDVERREAEEAARSFASDAKDVDDEVLDLGTGARAIAQF